MRSNETQPIQSELNSLPGYSFSHESTLLFISGAPLSGKSTVTPLVTAGIEKACSQSMDILRLIAQDREYQKPEKLQNPFVRYGSCDSFAFVGDGSYSKESLISGFNAYADVVSSLLDTIIPKLENQNSTHVIFEGVQLTPRAVSPYLNGPSLLVLLTGDENVFEKNRYSRYGNDPIMHERYATERLMHIQEELLMQTEEIPASKVQIINTNQNLTDIVYDIFDSLVSEKVIFRNLE